MTNDPVSHCNANDQFPEGRAPPKVYMLVNYISLINRSIELMPTYRGYEGNKTCNKTLTKSLTCFCHKSHVTSGGGGGGGQGVNGTMLTCVHKASGNNH